MAYDDSWLQRVFEQALPDAGYAVREEQFAMASFVQTAFTRHRHLLAEAGVGTGKTFAYLIPAFGHVMRTGGPVLVATHTIALQEQLVLRDVPAVARLLGLPISAMLAKGREHYLCPAREMAYREAHPEPLPEALALLQWARRTRSGDRAEAPAVSDALWGAVNLDAGRRCGGCRYEATCPTATTRRRWREATGLVVTNHHQFFADLALQGQGAHLFALPAGVVLDEAHALPDTARELLGHRSSRHALASALRAAGRQLPPDDKRAAALVGPAEAFFDALGARVIPARSEEAVRFDVKVDAPLADGARRLHDACMALSSRLGAMRATPMRLNAIEKLERAVAPLRGLLQPESHVIWMEGAPGRRRPPGELVSVLREPAGLLRQRLFSRGVPVVLTSATLGPDGDFSYLREELGVERPLACAVGSPFDYATQARLYLPDDLPDPALDADAFYLAALERLKALLEATRGRALVLFTAKSRLEAAHRALAEWGRFPLYRQDRADPELLARFARDGAGVLLGTGYWEGIDVPGPALSCVVVVKLPFPPEDPLLRARSESASARGEAPFEAVVLPEMLLKLKQGAGRLIRREDDRGVVAVLDPRASSRGYAEAVSAALPEASRLETLAQVAEFLR